MFYKKVEKFCFVVNFFICIVIKNYLFYIKSLKKLKFFLKVIMFFFLEKLKEIEGNRGLI